MATYYMAPATPPTGWSAGNNSNNGLAKSSPKLSFNGSGGASSVMSGDTIRIAASVTAAAGSITCNTVGSSVTLQAINATEWVATAVVGTWTF